MKRTYNCAEAIVRSGPPFWLPVQIQSEIEQQKWMEKAKNAQNAMNWEVSTSQLAQG